MSKKLLGKCLRANQSAAIYPQEWIIYSNLEHETLHMSWDLTAGVLR